MSTFRTGRALDALTPAFVQWFDDGSPGAAAVALHFLKHVEPVLARYLDGTATADLTAFDPDSLAAAFTEEVAARVAGDSALPGAENAVFAVEALHAYVDFLVETDRWTGSEGQLARVMTLFPGAGDQEEDGYLEVPDIPDEQALEVLSALPLIQRVTALLRWIGSGKPVTATGALRLRDIEAAAACVGVAVRGAGKRIGDELPGTERLFGMEPMLDVAPAAGAARATEAVPTVRSMYEVPLLAPIWAALQAAEIIDVMATKVVPYEGAEGFLTGTASQQVSEISLFISCFLEEYVLRHDPGQPWEGLVAGMQTSILMAAATPDPPALERVLGAADRAPEAEKLMASAITRLVVARLEDLAELGLLIIDSRIRVPPALIRAVADAFDDDQVLADLGLADDPDTPGTAVSGARPDAPSSTPLLPSPWPAGAVLQLKVMLKESKPPIWRRVTVPAGMSLAQLHLVIQVLFGWLDYHLHHFQAGNYDGPLYAPVDPDGGGDFYGEPSRDESKASVGDVLPAVGSTLTYTYDFGDNWEHAVTVEKVLTDDDGAGQLPQCTAGRGAAPAEDSGGIWGWENIVQAVNDPGHPEHETYREWLGLPHGESLDPKAFGPDEVNQNLARLF